MQERKRLRRRCNSCQNIFDVWRETDTDWYDGFSGKGNNRVSWTSDPFQSEINDDHALMWLCDQCYYDSSMEI